MVNDNISSTCSIYLHYFWLPIILIPADFPYHQADPVAELDEFATEFTGGTTYNYFRYEVKDQFSDAMNIQMPRQNKCILHKDNAPIIKLYIFPDIVYVCMWNAALDCLYPNFC